MSVLCVDDTDQATILRENTSVTNATYANPCHVATYVISAAQSWFGRFPWNGLFTLSAG